MKPFLLTLLLLSPLVFAEDQRLVLELTISELKEIVREIVEESIEKCTVSGTMNGRAKINLNVEGEIVAKIDCVFEGEEKKSSLANGKQVQSKDKINQ